MDSPLKIRPADYPEPYPRPELHILERVEGTVRGRKEFAVHNSGPEPLTVTCDVVPQDGWPPADSFTVDEPQFELGGGESRSLMVEVMVPEPTPPGSGKPYLYPPYPPIVPHFFRARLRSPGVPQALSVPVECRPPTPPGGRLTVFPEGGLDLGYGRNDLSFSMGCVGMVAVTFKFDIGAPDGASASWFRVDEPVQTTPGHDWIGQPGTRPPRSLTWEVIVDAEAAKASGRSSVRLTPTVRFSQPLGSIDDPYRPDEGGISISPGRPPDPYAQWRTYYVRIP